MFTNVSRPSAVDVLRPFAVGDQFYANTTSTLAKEAIGSEGQVQTVSSGIPAWSFSFKATAITAATSAGVLIESNNGTDVALFGAGGGSGATFYGGVILGGTTTVIDSNFSIIGSGDATKALKFEVDAMTGNDDLTISTGAQTDDRTLTVPVLTANATLMVLSEAQTVTGVKTFDADIAMSTNRNIRTATNGDYLSLIGGVTLASDPGFQIFGSTYPGIPGFMYLDTARFILRGINGATTGVVDIVGTTATTGLGVGALVCAGAGAFTKEVVAGDGLWLVDGITAPGTTAGYAKLYVDTADGDLKIRFGDGTVKTIVTDT
jgi:hypothetical protein